MSHEVEVARFGPFASLFPQAVKKGDTIWVSGQISVDEKGAPTHAGDFAAQLEAAYAGVRETLAHFGASMSDVVDETIFVTDVAHVMNDLAGFGAVRSRAFDAPSPNATLTLTQAASLVMPELLVEVRCVARV